MKSWYRIVVELAPEAFETASNVLFELGCCGIQEEAEENDGRLIAYFPSETLRAEVLRQVRARLPSVTVSVEEVETTDWAATWRDRFEPVWPSSRIVVCAPWHEVAEPENGIRILIEPKTAFGTGGHPTTRLALRTMEGVIRPGDRVLDVGTGSGILAIAARRLGASEALAVDTDPQAIENVRENAALNGVDGIVVETRSVAAEDSGYDLVVANIISSILRPMLGRLHHAVLPGGHVIFGGLLSREHADFQSSLESASFGIVDVVQEAEWIGFTTSRS